MLRFAARVSGLAPAASISDDHLLRRSFHAAGQPAHAQIGGRFRCPWVTAGDRSFPPVLARTWHASRGTPPVVGI